MTPPHGNPINLQRNFPRDRKEAAKIAELVKQQALAAGCTCRELAIEFIEPPLGKPYVQAGHDVLCPMSTVR